MAKQNYKEIDRWKSENQDRIVVIARKEEHLAQRVQMAVDAGLAPSRSTYIVLAVLEALARDGIAEIPDEQEQPL